MTAKYNKKLNYIALIKMQCSIMNNAFAGHKTSIRPYKQFSLNAKISVLNKSATVDLFVGDKESFPMCSWTAYDAKSTNKAAYTVYCSINDWFVEKMLKEIHKISMI